MHDSIVLGGGCFWCTEAVFRRVPGVVAVEPGYAGGTTPHPTYDDVSRGSTGHAEVVSVTFDPARVSLERLLAVFFATHDPTTINRQGADRGTQYRSIILCKNEAQRAVVDQVLATIRPAFADPIVTEVAVSDVFTPAEISHQEYYEKHPNASYCRYVIEPKLAKLREALGE